MILANKSADYSACGLGSIDIPIVVTDECLEIMSHFPSYNTEGNRKEMQKLMDRLGYGKNESIWSKLLVLTIPCLSSQASEAVYNILANESVFRYGSNYEMLELSDRALMKKKSDHLAIVFNIPSTSGGVVMPFVYKKEITETETTTYFYGVRTGDARTVALLYSDNGTKSIAMPQTHFVGGLVINGNTTSGSVSLVSDSDIVTKQTTEIFSTAFTTVSFGNSTQDAPVVPYRVIGMGANLTLEEAAKLRNAIHIFVEAVMEL